MESSGDEQNPHIKNTHSTSSTSSTLPGASVLSDVATQQAINLQILSQLSSISDRLNTLEKKGVKKDSDPKKKKSSTKTKTTPPMTPGHTAISTACELHKFFFLYFYFLFHNRRKKKTFTYKKLNTYLSLLGKEKKIHKTNEA